jgi:DNA invertase Pin-like site-specific DNA recombinase
MKIGYARVSTEEQNLDLQLKALRAAGCARIFEDSGVSGAAAIRPGLRKTFKALRRGDVLVVWRLDRLGRSVIHLLESVRTLQEREIGFHSLQEQIDTTSAAGRFYLHMLAALAEFERELIRDRTRAGMAAARDRGTIIGRPRKMSDAQVNEARERLARGEKAGAVAAAYEVSTLTLRRMLAERR